MERTFKHKKTGELAFYKDGIFKQGRFTVEIGVEPSSEFWEKVISKNYEILSFYTPESDSILDKKSNGLFSYGSGSGYYSEEDLLSGDRDRMDLKGNDLFDYVIYSVKRLTDGQVFSLGDKAKDSRYGFVGTIDKFKINGGSVYVSSKENVWGQDLSNLIKYEEPKVLFTTLDNVELKHGDKFYVVDTKFFKIFEAEAGITFKTEKWIKNSYFDRKLAEEWIVMNKPVLSLNDLLDNWCDNHSISTYKYSTLFQNFKKVAENKIKNQ